MSDDGRVSLIALRYPLNLYMNVSFALPSLADPYEANSFFFSFPCVVFVSASTLRGRDISGRNSEGFHVFRRCTIAADLVSCWLRTVKEPRKDCRGEERGNGEE